MYNVDDINDKIPISTKVLNDTLKGHNIIVVNYRGNYMYPFLLSNDELFIDLDQKHCINDAIYLIKDKSTACTLIRRARKLSPYRNEIFLECDNKDFNGGSSLQVTEDEFNTIVYGRVVFFCRSIVN